MAPNAMPRGVQQVARRSLFWAPHPTVAHRERNQGTRGHQHTGGEKLHKWLVQAKQEANDQLRRMSHVHIFHD